MPPCLGTRLRKVNITKLRKDETRPSSQPGFDLPCFDDDLHKDLMERAFSGLYTKDSSCEALFANGNCVTKGKIHVLEAFAGSARMNGSMLCIDWLRGRQADRHPGCL